jgi:hypothetical protein
MALKDAALSDRRGGVEGRLRLSAKIIWRGSAKPLARRSAAIILRDDNTATTSLSSRSHDRTAGTRVSTPTVTLLEQHASLHDSAARTATSPTVATTTLDPQL